MIKISVSEICVSDDLSIINGVICSNDGDTYTLFVVLVFLAAVLVLSIAGQTMNASAVSLLPADHKDDTEPAETESDPVSSDTGNVTLELIESDEASGYYYGLVTAFDPDGIEIWTYRTEEFGITAVPDVYEIGMTEDAYYLVSLGSVLALDLLTGELLWENADFQGCVVNESIGSAMDENGIYLAGFYGPDFFAVSYSGETLARIESFDPNYSMADVVHLLGDGTAVIRMMIGSGDDFSGFCVNLSDWTYFFVEDVSVYAEETDHVSAITHKDDYYEYADITAYDKYSDQVWEYQTDEYTLADTSRLNEIGLYEETYYYSEYGRILALDKWTGDILWENASLPSGAYTYLHAFDDAGNLYGFASVQPGSDLTIFGIEADGDTIGLITDFGSSYEAVSLEISDGQAVVHLNSYEEGEVVAVIDLDTFAIISTDGGESAD